ncbi:MAG: DUF4836 family protein [Ferruginibacter sp.]|nr:DUF4836 family protein [Ferruginibacter sp.]
MQTTHFFKLMTIGAAAIIFSSCAKTNTQGKLIPKEAAIVIQLDGKSLSSKLPWDEIKQNPLFQEMNGDSSLPATLKSLLDNPDNAGIDSHADLMLFVIKDSMGGYIGFEGKVKDESIFKTFNKQITENGAESEKDGVQFISKSPVCVGWTKEKFVYVFDVPQLSQMDELTKRMMRDSIDVRSRSARDIGATCKAVFVLKESNSLAKDEKFTQLMKETGDIHFWMNSEELGKGGSSATALAMVNLDKFYKGNITTATLDFDKGKMLVKAKTYASEEMVKLFKKYSGGKINEDMIRRMPGKDVVAIMALNFKPEAIRELIKMTGLDGLINLGVEKIGFSMDDFIKANKGDIFFGLSDLVMKPDTTTYKFKEQEENISISEKPGFNFIFSASIGDKESFNKLLNAGKKIGREQYSDSSKVPVSFSSNGTYFALSNNKQNVDQYLGTAGTDFDFISKISGESFGGYLNIQTLLKSFGNLATKDSSAKIAYDASLKMWDNILWKGGNYSEDGIQQTIEINLVDKTTNSLKQLNQYAAKLSELYKEQRRKQKEEIMAFQDFESSNEVQPTVPAKSK